MLKKKDGTQQHCPMTAMGEAFNPFVDPYLSNPYEFYIQAREQEPVFYSPEINHWVVASYEDVKNVLMDSETYSSRKTLTPIRPVREAIGMLLAQDFKIIPNLTNDDPPSHTLIRKFLQNAFTPRRIRWLEPHVRRLATESIDSFIHKGTTDLVKDLLYHTPVHVLFTFLGIPTADIEKIKTWSENMTILTWGKPSDEEAIARTPSFIEHFKYCFDLVDYLEQNPGEDYISELLQRLKTEKPEGIDKNRIALILIGLLVAGQETTSNQAGLGVRALLKNREAWEEIKANPQLIPNAVEEIIRFDSSVIAWRRVTNKPVTLSGVDIPAGEQLLVLLASANHDEKTFANGATFDIHRKNARQNLSFGYGNHYCIGAPLARLELRILLEELTKRLPDLELVEEQTYSYSQNTSHRGPSSLWVKW